MCTRATRPPVRGGAVRFHTAPVRVRSQAQPQQPDAGLLGNLLVVFEDGSLDGGEEDVLALRLIFGRGFGTVVALDREIDDGLFGSEGQFLLGLEPDHPGEFGRPGGWRQDKRLEDGLAARNVHQNGCGREVHRVEGLPEKRAHSPGVGQVESLRHVGSDSLADACAAARRLGLNDPELPAVEVEGTEPAGLLPPRQPFDLLGKRCHDHLVRSTSSGSSANGIPSRVMSRR